MEEPIPITEALNALAGVKKPNVSAVTKKKANAPPCKYVFVDERDKSKPLPYWRVIARGVYNNIRILYTSPQPCLLVRSTKVNYSTACSYNFREAKNNIILEEDCGTGRAHIYAYPKNVWEELFNYYIKPMVEGEEPYNVGVILMGPPGTGKSRLAQIIAKYAGINSFSIDTTLLSKWVGESENKLRDIIEKARSNQPSIIILDDAEWILIARKLSGETDGGLASVRLNLQQILFSAMQEIYDKKERVLFVATTNAKQEILDPALIRHGRFGPPIFVPLPDLEATKIIIRDILPDKPEEEIEKIAFTAVNAGLSVADTIALAERVKRGGDPRPRTVGGRGYARIFIEKIGEFESLEKEYKIPIRDMLSGKSRLSILGNEDVATAIAVQLAYSSGKTVIKLTDTRYIDEAIHSANMLGSVFIAPTRLPPELQYYIHDNADVSVIYVGDRPPEVPTFYLGEAVYIINRVGIRAGVKAVLALKGLGASDRLLEMIEVKAGNDQVLLDKILRMIATTSVVKEDYFENTLAWMK